MSRCDVHRRDHPNPCTPIHTQRVCACTITVPLEIIAFTAKPASRLMLQLVATTVVYAQPRLGGRIDFRSVRVELRTVTSITG